MDEPIDVARRFLRESHPAATASLLAGSVAAGTATETSDLDVASPYEDRPANYAETVRYGGWLIESFVYDQDSLEEWFEREAKQRRPVALDMWSNGIPLTDDP